MINANYNLQAASYESPYSAYQRIERSAPRDTLTNYSYDRQLTSPATPVFGKADIDPNMTPEQLRNYEDSRRANQSAIRGAMDQSVQDQGTHIRLYREYQDERGGRGQELLARA